MLRFFVLSSLILSVLVFFSFYSKNLDWFTNLPGFFLTENSSLLQKLQKDQFSTKKTHTSKSDIAKQDIDKQNLEILDRQINLLKLQLKLLEVDWPAEPPQEKNLKAELIQKNIYRNLLSTEVDKHFQKKIQPQIDYLLSILEEANLDPEEKTFFVQYKKSDRLQQIKNYSRLQKLLQRQVDMQNKMALNESTSEKSETKSDSEKTKSASNSQVNSSPQVTTSQEEENAKDLNKTKLKKKYRYFSGWEFKQIFLEASANYTKVKAPIAGLAEITGEPSLDARIVEIAEKRGYLKQKLALEQHLIATQNNQRLQREALEALEKLQAEARKDGLNLVLVSGYRSVQEQRNIFLSRLGLDSVSLEQILSGEFDTLVNQVLITSSIPGYSRHHTGYTFDLGCGDFDLLRFAYTPCFEWLSRDNYLNAKRFGIIPSYPEGAGLQGPDPEAWEYVWVGESYLLAE